MQLEPIGRRAILKKQGSPDVKVEVTEMERGAGFSLLENGKASVTWPKYSPQQLMSGDTPRRTLEEVWQSLLAKYPGYSATAVEDLLLQPSVQ